MNDLNHFNTTLPEVFGAVCILWIQNNFELTFKSSKVFAKQRGLAKKWNLKRDRVTSRGSLTLLLPRLYLVYCPWYRNGVEPHLQQLLICIVYKTLVSWDQGNLFLIQTYYKRDRLALLATDSCYVFSSLYIWLPYVSYIYEFVAILAPQCF